MLLLFKLDKHVSEIEYGFLMLENGGNTNITMTMFVGQCAFFVNNGLDKLIRHVAYGKTVWPDDFHFSCTCNSITTT